MITTLTILDYRDQEIQQELLERRRQALLEAIHMRANPFLLSKLNDLDADCEIHQSQSDTLVDHVACLEPPA